MAVQQPGAPTYRSFASVRQVARRYGASERTVRRLRRVARRHGLAARLDRSGVFARLTGRVRTFERVFGVKIRKQFDNDVLANTWFLPPRRNLRLPRDLRPLVREVVPVYARSTRRAGVRAEPPAARARRRRPQSGRSCASAGYGARQQRHVDGRLRRRPCHRRVRLRAGPDRVRARRRGHRRGRRPWRT